MQTMRWTILAPVVSLAALVAAPVSASLSDFRLPGASTEQPQPDRQGPVAPDVPESRGPRPTPAPTASRAPAPTPTPQPTASAPAIVVPDLADRAPSPVRTTRAPAASSPAATGVATPEPTSGDEPVATEALPPAIVPTLPSPAPAAPQVAAAEEQDGPIWPWVLGGFGLLGLLGLGGWAWRRRPGVRPRSVPVVERPHVERPRLAQEPPPGAAPAPAADTASPTPLQVTLEPLRLSLTLVNATLAYRLEVANRGAVPITALRIGADMISAHASMTREQQLSGPGAGAATLQRIERIEPGESRIVEGEFRLPFPQIVPIRQGNAALLLPLARFRLEAEGAEPLVRTFAVGQPGEKAGLQPFRLDLGPRVYPKLTQRAFA